MPDNRSFLDIVNGMPAPSRRAPSRQLAARLRAFAFSRPWVVTLCVAIVGLCAAIYGAIGYVEEQSAAVERKPALRAARADASPKRAVARETVARETIARETIVRSREDTSDPELSNGASTDAKPSPPVPADDRTASLMVALGPINAQLPDARLPDFSAANTVAAILSDGAARSDAYVARAWGRIGARDAEEQLNRLNLAYAELVDERDQLRARVKELEQTLSSLQMTPGSPQAARTAPDNSVGAGSARPGAAVIAFPGAAPSAPSGESARPTVKNFTTPGSVPNYFSDESGAILGNHAAAPHR